MRENNGRSARTVVGHAVMALLVIGCLSLLGPAYADQPAKVLNNLVAELLNIQAPQTETQKKYTFTNPRDGWVFVSSSAETKGAASAYLVLDSESKSEAIIVHGRANPAPKEAFNADSIEAYPPGEAMRHLSAGQHVLNVYCDEGASVQSLVVRAIPEILYAEISYRPSRFLPSYTPFTWEFLERIGLARNLNVVIEREPEAYMQWSRWRAQGRKLLEYSNLYWLPGYDKVTTADDSYYKYWSERQGLLNPRYDGIIMDEFSPGMPQLPSETEGVRRISQAPQFKGKSLYAYCIGLYDSEESRAFSKAMFDGGHKLVEEQYLGEEPTEADARKQLDHSLRQNMLLYQKAFPGCQKDMVVCVGYMSAPPESLDTNPGVDYKVFLDMQFNFIANDPAFAGLYGIMCYHSAFADEEVIRWTAKLYRHYCIEGKKEMLSKDPYMLAHVQNPDFADGATGWTLSPAEEGSMTVKSVPKYSWLQGRYPPTPQGDTFLWTRRSAKAPNRFSQQMKNLQPGRLYSLKMFLADYQDLMQGREVKQKHQASIRMDNVDLIPCNSFQDVFPSGRAGHLVGKFTRDNNLWISFYNLVFRARSQNATLTISDWASDANPGGPIGQELMFNFIEVGPFLED